MHATLYIIGYDDGATMGRHDGEPLRGATCPDKWLLRSDIMYRRDPARSVIWLFYSADSLVLVCSCHAFHGRNV